VAETLGSACNLRSFTVYSSAFARGVRITLTVIAATVSALSIAICAAAPELVWQGLLVASRHVSGADLLSALLIGLVLAFVVDPLMERIRHALSRHRQREALISDERKPLFTTCIGVAFALVSVCLHSALTDFVSGPEGHAGANYGELEAAVRLTAEWAFVPFFVTAAWIGVRSRWAKVPLGFLAGVSPLFAGWLFSWSWQDIVITALPCIAILLFGYPHTVNVESQLRFAPYARSVIFVAVVWLVATALAEVVLYSLAIDPFRFNSSLEFWIDSRFYFGWALGLLITPFPFHSGSERLATSVR
jgi:hypothetical protein